MPEVIYQTPDGRVSLIRRTHGKGRTYSVDIAGGEYGPYSWADALSMYRKHKG